MDSALGVLLDGAAVKKMRKPPKNLRTWKAALSRWFADASSAPMAGEPIRAAARLPITAPVGRLRFPNIKLEKTSLKGSLLAGDRKFFQVGELRSRSGSVFD